MENLIGIVTNFFFMLNNNMYYCYLIVSQSHPTYTYIGITNNLEKRLKQHNGLLKGGAKCTRKFKDWIFFKIIKFTNEDESISKSNACSFEWNVKHYKTSKGTWYRTKSGIENKIKRIYDIIDDYQCEIEM